RYSLPGPTTPVTIEIDPKNLRAGDEDLLSARVDLTFDRIGDGSFEHVEGSPFRGLRDLAIGWKLEGGKMALRTRVADRVVLLNTEGFKGKGTLGVQVLSGRDKKTPLPLADEQDTPTERIALYDSGPTNKSAPLRFLRGEDKVLAEIV